ncbi:RNase H domain-containing protein [Trichonephila clavipes]|nr:RNase H domain-containing protein [Trichonephila clavipes]
MYLNIHFNESKTNDDVHHVFSICDDVTIKAFFSRGHLNTELEKKLGGTKRKQSRVFWLYHGAEASIFCELLSFYLPLGIFTTSFDGEIEAIAVAVEQLSLRSSEFNRVVIFSDSKSALQALSQNCLCNSQRIFKCRSFLQEVPHKISFQWIPVHCGIARNEHADFLAKKRALVIQKLERISTFHSLWPFLIWHLKITLKWKLRSCRRIRIGQS